MLPRERVERDLRRRIKAGEWEPAARLPPVGELSAHYQVSGATISKALGRLADEGLIVVIASWGTFMPGPE